jgi:UDP-N-acetylglucosamine--N-acetylmuramyl-(pentapeptide) pyrophosphoryl-undecaprenol N-acetylglucosamine transferase
VIPDSELTSTRLAQEVGRLLADPARLEAMAQASRRLARPEAGEAIARELLAVGSGD